MNGARLGRLLAVTGLLTAISATPIGADFAQAADSSGPFTATKTVSRINLAADGTDQVVGTNTVKIEVDQTKKLRGRQDIAVSWSGAKPTGGIQPDLNSVLADQQEYPMVLLECRGAANQVTPQTCWTHGSDARYQGIAYSRWAPWRADRYATTADRAAVVGRPSTAASLCGSAPLSEHWLQFDAVGGKNYYYGNQSCAGLPPEDFNFDLSTQVVPQNATFAPTLLDGTGSVKFNLTSSVENASLGCAQNVQCTLEVIPIMGISCDPYGVSPVAKDLPPEDIPPPAGTDDSDNIDRATTLCEATGQYQPGITVNGATGTDLAVSGALWWSESNWRNRIAVPLSFAPVSDACQQVSNSAPVAVYGSELMNEATAQWAPKFCLDPSLFRFTHVQTAEPLARNLLNDPTSGVHAAFGTLPPESNFTSPTIQAPVAVTGFSISYNVDDTKGKPVTNLRMDARLLAKLLTESYPGDDFDRFKTGQFPYLHGNPINITKDPEFQALNPGISVGGGFPGAASLIALSAESDVMSAVTAYINADPDARAWLNGAPDPWGMVVNPKYKGMELPTLRWPLLDTTLPDFGDQVLCTKYDPAPWLPLVASPTAGLATTTIDVQFAAATGKTACGLLGDPTLNLYQWNTIGRQFPGQRFVLGITSLGEAARYDMSTAALQSVDSTFVSPTPSALSAAASHATWSDTAKVWQVSPTALHDDKSAYPGTMLVNLDVPTTGLTNVVARDYAKLMDYAAGPGQIEGSGNGQLPPGYLPMTTANGLGKLVSYTTRAAIDVAKQRGVVTPLVPVKTQPGTPSSEPTTGTTPPPIGGATLPAGGPSSAPSSGPNSAPPTTSAAPAAQHTVISTQKTGLGAAGWLLPVLLGAGVLGGLLAGGSTMRPKRRR